MQWSRDSIIARWHPEPLKSNYRWWHYAKARQEWAGILVVLEWICRETDLLEDTETGG